MKPEKTKRTPLPDNRGKVPRKTFRDFLPRHIQWAVERSTEGATQVELAHYLNCAVSTMARMLRSHPDYSPVNNGWVKVHREKTLAKAEWVQKQVREGFSNVDIASKLGCTESRVWQLINIDIPAAMKSNGYDDLPRYRPPARVESWDRDPGKSGTMSHLKRDNCGTMSHNSSGKEAN